MKSKRLKKMALTLALFQLLSHNANLKAENSTIKDSVEIKSEVSLTSNKWQALRDNIYVNYSDPDNPVYKRYDLITGKLKDISIFDDENNNILQYGGNQTDFKYKFQELIKDKLIWEELQKYYPLELFDSEEEAYFFMSVILK